MTCDADICGTGGFTGPKPGDPDNNVTLSASATFGGIDVSWSYPTSNPAAVAHTLLFRALSSDFSGAIERAVVSGNSFYDKVATEITYFYWIQIVSVNGTVGARVGPVSATSHAMSQDLKTVLAGQIDEGLLATVLRSDLNHLSILNANLAAEIFDREGANISFAQALLDVQNGVADAHTYIANEVNSRVTATSAIAESVNLLAVALGSNVAAVQTNVTAWVTSSNTRMTGFDSQFGTVNNKVSDIGALYTTKLTVNGLVGGFGVYNDGTSVEAGFDVDTFWVGRTNADKHKPFIVSGGVVYLDQAVIRDADITTLKIAGNAVTVPLVAHATPMSSYPAGDWRLATISATSYFKAGANISAIVSAVVVATGSCNCRIGAYLWDGSTGVTIFDTACSLVNALASTPVFSGTKPIPWDGNWQVVVWIGNNWSSGSFYCGELTLNAFGAKK